MKSFFAGGDSVEHVAPSYPRPPVGPGSSRFGYSPAHSARLAVYDSAAAAPRVTDIQADSVDTFIESVSATTYQAAHELGGDIPYTAIREVAENLIHANFSDPVVSVMDRGRLVRFADRGPGIADKDRAVLPGFTTACGAMKDHIRGVGSGLPIVREYLSHHQGVLEIDDNLGGGAVITLRAAAPAPLPITAPEQPAVTVALESRATPAPTSAAPDRNTPRLTTRHKRVLSLVMEVGAAGPTLVSKELKVGLSTAHRDLAFLESSGLIIADEGGKRVLTSAGAQYLDSLFEQDD